MLSDSLILDMPLAQVSDETSGDMSPRRRPFRTIGAPLALGDSKLGASTVFDGDAGLAVTLADMGASSGAFTVSCWLKITAPPGELAGQAALVLLGDPASGAVSLTAGPPAAGVSSRAGATLHLRGIVAGQPGSAVETPVPLNAWRHVALVREGEALTLFVDGQASESVDVSGLTLGSTDILVGQFPAASARELEGLRGEIARLRVHKDNLAWDELLDLIDADQTPRGRLDEALPLGFRLLDAGGNPNLYIEDHPDGHILTVEVQNLSAYEIAFDKTQGAAPRLTFTFPPGTLHPAETPVVLESELWALSLDKTALDGSQTLILEPTGTENLRFAPGQVRTFTLQHLRAVRGDGTRPCRIACGFEGLTSLSPWAPGPSETSGLRDKVLQIVNHTGSRFLPLSADIAGIAQVSTGTEDAALTIRLRNVSSDRTIYFEPPALDETGTLHAVSAFEFHLLPGTPGVAPSEDPASLLAGADGFDASVLVAPDGWKAEKQALDSDDPFWLIHPEVETRLGPGEELSFALSSLEISRLPGEARVKIVHRGLPGFWYGSRRLTVEKSPFVFDTASQVGIGVEPRKPMTIRGRESVNGTRSEMLGFYESDGGMVWHINHLDTVTGQYGGLNFVESNVDDFRLFLQEGGSVGINTSHPEGQLHVNSHTDDAATELVVSSPLDHYCAVSFKPTGYKESYVSATQNEMTVATRENSIYVGAAAAGNLYITRESGQDLRADTRVRWTDSGVVIQPALHVFGTISSSVTKSFEIPHPDKPGERLIHACLEGPEAGVYYRGEASLEGGTATVTLPAYFESLTRPEGRTIQLTAKGRKPFLLSYEDIADGRFTVHGSEPEGSFAWEVRAVRADIPPLECEPGP